MFELDLSADDFVAALLHLAESEMVCILDSCNVRHLGSHLMIAGIEPAETIEISNDDPAVSLRILDEKLTSENLAGIFTFSYDLGLKLEGIKPRPKEFPAFTEPDIFLALFDCLLIHDNDSGKSILVGNENRFADIRRKLQTTRPQGIRVTDKCPTRITSNFSKAEYIKAIETIKEHIRCGDTYQLNLTRQIRAEMPENLTPEEIFRRIRRDNPAPFAAFLKRPGSTVVSASPERFFRVTHTLSADTIRTITASPIKGTRPRGRTPREDSILKNELLNSDKDRAENTMIVDLLRNDLGRVCEFGSVKVEKLCELQEFPTLFHLVSTISGDLRENVSFSDIIRAVFPCGSVTGAPKIRTMQIIDELETANRGLSMGAIGYYIPDSGFQIPDSRFDLSVAIRTMVVRDGSAVFNVGGGIVIDSDPEWEYEETLVKAKALLSAIGARI